MMETVKKSKMKKLFDALGNVLLIIFLIIAILSVVVTLVSKKDVDGAAELFGYQFRIVTSSSMGASEHTDVSNFKIKSIPIRSMVFIELVPDDESEAKAWYDELAVGDVLTFKYVYTTQVTITHRIVSKTDNGRGGYIIELEGDNKDDEDGQLTQVIDTSNTDSVNYIIGKVTGKSLVIGAALSVLKSKLGIILIIMLPCVFIISLEAAKIINVLTADKKKRQAEESERKDNELAELRRQLEELQKKIQTKVPLRTAPRKRRAEQNEYEVGYNFYDICDGVCVGDTCVRYGRYHSRPFQKE